jgi:signal peptidase II
VRKSAADVRGWLALAALVIVLDQLTKQGAAHWLVYGQPVPIVPSLNFTLLHNTGAAFSFLAGAAGWQRWFFSALALGVSVYLVVLLRAPAPSSHAHRAGLSLVLGGALGNLIDRLCLGYVVDFIQVYYQTWYFPAFNVADSAITVGAGLLIVSTFVDPPAADNAKDRDRCV